MTFVNFIMTFFEKCALIYPVFERTAPEIIIAAGGMRGTMNDAVSTVGALSSLVDRALQAKSSAGHNPVRGTTIRAVKAALDEAPSCGGRRRSPERKRQRCCSTKDVERALAVQEILRQAKSNDFGARFGVVVSEAMHVYGDERSLRDDVRQMLHSALWVDAAICQRTLGALERYIHTCE